MPRNSPANPSRLDRLIALARQYIGTPYQWGGSSPGTGFDCSGFVMWLYKQQGVSLPRTTYDQWKQGTAIAKGSLRPGDIVFFEPSKAGPGHEGLYIGHGMFIESPHTGASIRISSLAGRSDYMGARRVIPGGTVSLGELTGDTAGPSNSFNAVNAPQKPKKAHIPVPAGEKQIGGFQVPGAMPANQMVQQYVAPYKQAASNWNDIIKQPNVSPETLTYAQNAQIASGASAH